MTSPVPSSCATTAAPTSDALAGLASIGTTYQGLNQFKKAVLAITPSLMPDPNQKATASQVIVLDGVEKSAWYYTMRCNLGNAAVNSHLSNRCPFYVKAQGLGPDRKLAEYTIIAQCEDHSEHVCFRCLSRVLITNDVETGA